MLREEEIGFVGYLQQAKVNIPQFKVKWEKLANIQQEVKTFEDEYKL